MNSPLTYWERKILNWEKARYSKWLWFYPLSWTVRNRLHSAIEILKRRGKRDWKVIELGCGSGILASQVHHLFSSYTGVDIAANAVSVAQQRIHNGHVQFLAADVQQMEFEKYDLALFLGLTDWLEKDQLQELFARLNSRYMLFSYTEKEIVSEWNPYYYYRKIMDRKSMDYSYKARSYSRAEIAEMVDKAGYKMTVLKPASMINPGVLIWAEK